MKVFSYESATGDWSTKYWLDKTSFPQKKS